MEKSLETAWMGLKVGWSRASSNHQGGANSVNQVDGFSHIASTAGSDKEQWPLPAFLSGRKLLLSCYPNARQFSASLYVSDTFQSAVPVLELRRSESE